MLSVTKIAVGAVLTAIGFGLFTRGNLVLAMIIGVIAVVILIIPDRRKK